ncbi:MAG: hypothetical protein AB2A00_31165 [Myxococcota bacterium]
MALPEDVELPPVLLDAEDVLDAETEVDAEPLEDDVDEEDEDDRLLAASPASGTTGSGVVVKPGARSSQPHRLKTVQATTMRRSPERGMQPSLKLAEPRPNNLQAERPELPRPQFAGV